MEVGVGLIFPGTGIPDGDSTIYRDQIGHSQIADALGYDSIWCTEHHFSRYQMTPDPLQILTYLAATTKMKVGTNAVILPWNDPTRVAERISVLDTLSGGRVLLGIGRGLGEVEFGGFDVPMSEARDRFLEQATMVRDALEDGCIESKGPFYPRPRRDLHPQPLRTFRDRRWAAAVSPESFAMVAELGFGLLAQAQKPIDATRAETERFWDTYELLHGQPPPPSVLCMFVYCDRDAGKAKELGTRFIGDYYDTVTEFYGLKTDTFQRNSGYDYYAKNAKKLKNLEPGADRDFYANLHIWGTPAECIEKIEAWAQATRAGTLVCNFSYSDISTDEVRHQMRLFADEIMPRVRQMDVHQRR